MHGEISPRAVMQALQACDAASPIVLAVKSYASAGVSSMSSRERVRTTCSEDLTGEHSHKGPHR